MTNKSISGGCQCGAVRFMVTGELTAPHLCHCRMCQKASGNYFMPLARVSNQNFETTRGKIEWFRSSDVVQRGFCGKCGTPLTFASIGQKHLQIVLGSLDHPESVIPTDQYGLEAKMSWFGDLDGLGGYATEEDPGQPEGRVEKIYNSNHQHPDYDTEYWPQK